MRNSMLETIYKQLDEKQAEDVLILEIGKLSSIADYFVIASADNERKVKAISDAIEDELTKEGIEPKVKEGLDTSRWILLDYGDIIVHVFKDEERDFYNIEKIWKDATNITSEFEN